MSLKQQLSDDMKAAMKSGDKTRLGVIRLINAAIKQRRDSINQYESAGREDLANVERFEVEVIQGYLPAQLSADEVAAAISEAITQTGASGPQDMGKVIGALKPRLAGRADMGQVSALVKARLAG